MGRARRPSCWTAETSRIMHEGGEGYCEIYLARISLHSTAHTDDDQMKPDTLDEPCEAPHPEFTGGGGGASNPPPPKSKGGGGESELTCAE